MKEVYVSNVPYTANECDLQIFLEKLTGLGTVWHCELMRDGFQPRHRGYGFVTFEEEEVAERVRLVSNLNRLIFQGRSLRINASKRQVKHNPEHSVFKLEGIVGLAMGCLTGDTFHTLWNIGTDVDSEFDFRQRKFSLKVVDYDSEDWKKPVYKLEFRFKYIYRTYFAETSGSSAIGRMCGPMWLFEMWYPPHVYEEEGFGNLEDQFEALRLIPRPKQPWSRTGDFTADRSIGQSFAYILKFDEDLLLGVSEFGKVWSFLEDQELASDVTLLLNVKTSKAYADSSPEVLVPLLKCPSQFRLTFRLMFVLNKLVQNGNLSGPSLSTNFFHLLYEAPEEEGLWVLENLSETVMVYINPEQWLRKELRRIQMGAVRLPKSTSVQLDEGLIWVYRVMVSPTKIHCVGREAEVSNRVTRAYTHLIDNFLRVTFIEEDLSILGSQNFTKERNGQSGVYKRVLKVLTEGIRLQGKHFEFLAFSSSQLREQSVWMFAQSNNVTANSIRAWMGNFLDIRNVAKCAARMGQCFSSTTKTLAVNPWEVEEIDDIVTADGRYCFSDGIGKISFRFAKKVAAKCGCHGSVPSAFQIRYGGFKGVVAVSHDLMIHKLSLRKSMNKFVSDHSDLEVISWTKRLPCYLNRQIITLLSTLGIRDHVFEQMQDLLLSKLNEVVTNVSVAMDILQMTSSGATHQITVEMLKAGYSPRAEPYLLSLLQAFRAYQLLQLRTKSRILVPKGRTMMGCLDETGILEYGQVFLRVSSFPGTRSFIDDGLQYEDNGKCVLEGPVVVAKNPCLHPGDVRVLQAVDVPELDHMVDCVVFPQRGDRPHPNECSGSDLDGDLYFVTWDQLLIPRQTDLPMDYDPPEIPLLPHPVIIGDIQKFFVESMKSDALGVISHAHVVHADQGRDMARDPKCLELAELFTVAVDFPKTGHAAVMDPDLRPQQYPDFMEKEDKVSYESKRVIGKLFRSVLEASRHRTLMSTIKREDIVRAFDNDLVWYGFEFYLEEATMLKEWYDRKLVGILKQFEIKTEAEALSGNIIPLSKFYIKRQGEVMDRISFAVRSLQSEARRWFKHGADGADNLHSADDSNAPLLEEREAFAKASAWYHVTYHPRYLTPTDSAAGKSYQYLLSFPWVVFDTLLCMKRRNRQMRRERRMR